MQYLLTKEELEALKDEATKDARQKVLNEVVGIFVEELYTVLRPELRHNHEWPSFCFRDVREAVHRLRARVATFPEK